MKNIKIAFLFGSGVSLCAKAPSTNQITQSLLNDADTIQPTDQVLLIKDFLNYSKMQIKDYYEWLHKPNLSSDRMLNYESIYYLVWQLWSSAIGDYFDNPAIFKLYKEMQNNFRPQIDRLNKDFLDDKIFIGFLENVLRYIENTVSQKLELELNNNCDYLRIVQEAYENKRIKKIEIFSLNHDTLIEQCFDNKKIEYSDGFIKDNLDIKIWNPKSFNNKFKVNLYKLHGSINWYQFFREDKREQFIGSVPIFIKDIDHIKDLNNSDLSRDKRHGILVGTFNKIFNYLSDVFIELNFRFYKTLLDFNYLVISGYSFNDNGVNLYIRRFMNSSYNKKAVIIDPDPVTLERNARRMISYDWDTWLITKKMETIYGKFEEIQLDKVMTSLEFMTSKRHSRV